MASGTLMQLFNSSKVMSWHHLEVLLVPFVLPLPFDSSSEATKNSAVLYIF